MLFYKKGKRGEKGKGGQSCFGGEAEGEKKGTLPREEKRHFSSPSQNIKLDLSSLLGGLFPRGSLESTRSSRRISSRKKELGVFVGRGGQRGRRRFPRSTEKKRLRDRGVVRGRGLQTNQLPREFARGMQKTFFKVTRILRPGKTGEGEKGKKRESFPKGRNIVLFHDNRDKEGGEKLSPLPSENFFASSLGGSELLRKESPFFFLRGKGKAIALYVLISEKKK